MNSREDVHSSPTIKVTCSNSTPKPTSHYDIRIISDGVFSYDPEQLIDVGVYGENGLRVKLNGRLQFFHNVSSTNAKDDLTISFFPTTAPRYGDTISIVLRNDQIISKIGGKGVLSTNFKIQEIVVKLRIKIPRQPMFNLDFQQNNANLRESLIALIALKGGIRGEDVEKLYSHSVFLNSSIDIIALQNNDLVFVTLKEGSKSARLDLAYFLRKFGFKNNKNE